MERDRSGDNASMEGGLSVAVSRRRVVPGERLAWRVEVPLGQPEGATLRSRLPQSVRFLTASRGTWDAARFEVSSPISAAGDVVEITVEVLPGPGPLPARFELLYGGEPVAVVDATPVPVDSPRVIVSVEVSAAEATPGDVLLYTVAWTADGADAGPGRLSVMLPEHVSVVRAAQAKHGSGREVSWDLGPLGAAASGAQVLTARVATVLPPGVSELSVIARLDAPGLVQPAVSPEVVTRVTAAPAISVQLRPGRSRALPGDAIPILLTLTNTGHAAAREVRVVLPDLAGTRVELEGQQAPERGVELHCSLIDVGDTEAVEWALRLATSFPAGVSTVTPTANVHVPGLEPIVVRGAPIMVDASPRLRLTLASEHVEATPGGSILFVARCKNVGTAEASQVAIGMPLPARCAPIPELSSGTVEPVRRQLVVRVGSLAPGAEAELRLGVRLDAVFPAGTTELVAESGAMATDLETIEAEPLVIRIQAAPQLSLEVKPSASEATPGEPITWSLVCRNAGDAPATRVVLTARVHDLAVVTSAPGATLVDETRRELSWPLGDLEPRQTVTAKLMSRLLPTYPVGETLVALDARAGWDDGGIAGRGSPVSVRAAPELALEAVVPARMGRPGRELVVVVHCRNVGDAIASDIHLGIEAEGAELLSAPGDAIVPSLEPSARVRCELRVRLPSGFPAGESAYRIGVTANSRAFGQTVAAAAEPVVVAVHAAPDLVIAARSDTIELRPGGSAAAELELQNEGDAAATDVVVVLRPGGPIEVVSAGHGEVSEDGVRWLLGAIPPGARASASVVLRPSGLFAAGRTRLPLVFESNAHEPHTGSRRTVELAVVAAPQLELSAWVDSESLRPGTFVRVTFTCANVGDAIAAGGVLASRLPRGLRFQAGGHWDPMARLVTWDLEPIAPGGDIRRELMLQLDPVFPVGETSLPMSAHVIASGAASELVLPALLVQAAPDLTLSVSADRADPSPGEPVIYTLGWTNNGDAPTGRIVLVDPLPPYTRFVSASAGGSFDEARHAALWSLAPTDPGGSGTVRLTLRIDDVLPVGQTRIANATMAELSELDGAFESPEHELVVEALPTLEGRLEPLVTAARPGEEVPFTLSVSVSGRAAATDVVAHVRFPDGFEVTQTEPNPASAKDGALVFHLGSMLPGTRVEARLVGRLDKVVPAALETLGACLRLVCRELPERPGESVPCPVEASPKLLVVLSAPAAVVPGEPFDLVVSVQNDGDAHLEDAHVELELPAGLALPDGGEPGAWRTGPVAGGGGRTETRLPVVARMVFPAGRTELAIGAMVRGPLGAPPEAVPPARLMVEALPELACEALCEPAEASPTDSARWRIRVTNRGRAPVSGMEVRAALPAPLALLSATGGQGVNREVHDGGGAHVVWSGGTLPPGETLVCTMSVDIPEVFEPGQSAVCPTISVIAAELESPVPVLVAPLIVIAEARATVGLEFACLDCRPGERVEGRVTVRNTGTACLERLMIQLPPLDGLTVGEPAAVPALAPGAEFGLSIEVRLAARFDEGTTALPVVAQLLESGQPLAASAAVTIEVVSAAELALTTRTAPRQALPGTRVEWCLSLQNHGSSNAREVAVFDTPPEGCRPIAVGEGSWDSDLGVICWSVGRVESGAEPTLLRWVGLLDPALPAHVRTIMNAPSIDAAAASQCEPGELAVDSHAVLGVSLETQPDTVEPGDDLTIRVRLGNGGEEPLSGAKLGIYLPEVLQGGQRTVWADLDIAPGETLERVLHLKAGDSLGPGRHTLSVMASADCGPLEVTRQETLTLSAVPALFVALEASKTEVVPGEPVEVSVVCRAEGRCSARDLRVALDFPAGFKATIHAADDGHLPPEVAPGSVRWRLAALAPGEVRTLRCEVVAQPADRAGHQVVRLQASAEALGVDAVATPLALSVASAPALAVSLEVSPNRIGPGEVAMVRMTVENVGTAPTRDARAHLDLPAALRPNAAELPSTLSLLVGERRCFELPVVGPTADQGGERRFDLAAMATDPAAESPGSDDATLLVVAEPRLSVQVTADRTRLAPGEVMGVTLRVSNTGTAPALDGRVSVSVPALFDRWEGGFALAGGRRLEWPVPTLEVGGAPFEVSWVGHVGRAVPLGEHAVPLDWTATAQDAAPVDARVAAQVVAAPALTLRDVRVEGGPVGVGEELTLCVDVENLGTAPGGARLVLDSEATDIVWRGADVDPERLPVQALEPGGRCERRIGLKVAGPRAPGVDTVGLTVALEPTDVVQAAAVGRARAGVDFEVRAAPALALRIEAPETIQPGDLVDLAVAYGVGPGVHAEGLALGLKLPPQLIPDQLLDGGRFDSATGAVFWSPPRSGAGDQGEARCRVRVADGLANGFQAPLLARGSARTAPTLAETRRALAVVAAPALALSAQVEGEEARPGDTLVYRLTVRNVGRAPALDVALRNPVPPELSVIAASQGGRLDELSDALLWTTDKLLPGRALDVEWRGRLERRFPRGVTEVLNVAAASCDGVASVEAVELTTRVSAAPALELRTTGFGSEPLAPGAELPVEVAWRNTGDAAAAGCGVLLRASDEVVEVSGAERRADGWYVPIGSLVPGDEGRATLAISLAKSLPRGEHTVTLEWSLQADGEVATEARLEAPLVAAPRLVVGMDASRERLRPGQLFEVSVSVANTGAAVSDDGELEILIPPEVRFEVPTEGLEAVGAGRWRLAVSALAVGERRGLRLRLVAPEAHEAGDAELRLAVRLNAGGVEMAEAASLRLPVRAAPRLTGQIEMLGAKVSPGSVVKGQITVQNEGDAPAKEVSVVLPVPPRMSVSAADGAVVGSKAGSHTATYAIGELGVGQSRALGFALRTESVFPAGETALTARARVSGAGLDPEWTAPASLVVIAAPALSVSVAGPADEARPNGEVRAVMRVCNQGTAHAEGVSFCVQVPPGASHVEAAGARLLDDGRTLEWPSGRLAPRAEHEVPVRFRLPRGYAAGRSEVEITARLAAEGLAEVSAKAQVVVVAEAKMTATLDVLPAVARPGAELTWRLRWRNEGDAVAAPVAIRFEPPAGTELMPEEPALADSGPEEAAPEETQNADGLLWRVAAIGPGQAGEATVVGRLAADYPAGQTEAVARLRVLWEGRETPLEQLCGVMVHAAPRILVGVTAPGERLTPGGEARFLLSWENAGDALAESVALAFQAAAGTTLEPPALAIGPLGPGERGTGEVVVQIPSGLPAGRSPVAPQVSLTVDGAAAVDLAVPAASVEAAADLHVTVTNEMSVAMAEVGSRVSVRSKTSDDTQSELARKMPVGANLRFRLSIENRGTAAAEGAEVEHELPPASVFVEASNGGVYHASRHAVTWSLGTVLPGGEPLVRTTVVRFGG